MQSAAKKKHALSAREVRRQWPEMFFKMNRKDRDKCNIVSQQSAEGHNLFNLGLTLICAVDGSVRVDIKKSFYPVLSQR